MKPDNVDFLTKQFPVKIVRSLVIVAMVLALTGGTLYLIHQGLSIADYGVFKSEPHYLRGITDVVKCAMTVNSSCMIQAGILILVFIPMLRLLLFSVRFFFERDYLYIVFSGIVLLILLFSFYIGSI